MVSANKIDCAKLKKVLEEHGKKFRVMWNFQNDKRTFIADKFRLKFPFNSRNEDAVIEIYLSCLEERFLDIKISFIIISLKMSMMLYIA